MSLKHGYTLVAPFYDAFLKAATHGARKCSLVALAGGPPRDVLLLGVGTGLDLTAAMLKRARPRAAGLHFAPLRSDVQRLPFHDASFDVAVLHLILAVVPAPTLCAGVGRSELARDAEAESRASSLLHSAAFDRNQNDKIIHTGGVIVAE
ncbi:MAG: class I SAM-dependent methyltransferase [Sulfuritalea sp.]|nr:class I SAM-dependent methyltransferase [Sulfuritalea sp.]